MCQLGMMHFAHTVTHVKNLFELSQFISRNRTVLYIALVTHPCPHESGSFQSQNTEENEN